MHVSGISWIGWIHTVACIAALALGGWNLVALKGSAGHKFRGTAYAATMVVAMALSFGIYHFDVPLRGGRVGPGVFGFFHWLSVAALLLTTLGYYASAAAAWILGVHEPHCDDAHLLSVGRRPD